MRNKMKKENKILFLTSIGNSSLNSISAFSRQNLFNFPSPFSSIVWKYFARPVKNRIPLLFNWLWESPWEKKYANTSNVLLDANNTLFLLWIL